MRRKTGHALRGRQPGPRRNPLFRLPLRVPLYLTWFFEPILQRLAELRHGGDLSWVRPDSKAQVTLEYENDRPVRVDTVVVSTQHDPDISQADLLADEDTPSPLEKAIEEEKTSSVRKILNLLPDRQRIILAMRYGIVAMS